MNYIYINFPKNPAKQNDMDTIQCVKAFSNGKRCGKVKRKEKHKTTLRIKIRQH